MHEEILAVVPGAQPKLTAIKDDDCYRVSGNVGLEPVPVQFVDLPDTLIIEALNPLPPAPHVKTLVQHALERLSEQ